MGRGFPYNVIKSYIMVAKRYLFLKKWGRMTKGKNMMGTMYDIVVIDSGSNIKNSVGLSVSCVNGVFEIHDGCRDNVGHGTAINYILKQNCTANIFNIGISIPEEEMNDNMHSYYINMRHNRRWKGIVQKIRLDPAQYHDNYPWSKSAAGECTIECIEFLSRMPDGEVECMVADHLKDDGSTFLNG